MAKRSALLNRPRIDPTPISGRMSIQELIDGTLLACDGGRLRDVKERERALGVSRRSILSKRADGRGGVLILGGGSPRNFLLQTEPQIPGEAVSWGKVDREKLPDTIVCHVDSTVALPLIAAHALETHPPRKPKRLYHRRETLVNELAAAFRKVGGLRTD